MASKERSMAKEKTNIEKHGHKLDNCNRRITYLIIEDGQERTFDRMTDVAMQPPKPIIVPSQVFFGLTFVSGVLPNACRKALRNHKITTEGHKRFH